MRNRTKAPQMQDQHAIFRQKRTLSKINCQGPVSTQKIQNARLKTKEK